MNRYRPAVADRKKKTLWEWNDYQNFRFHRVFCVKSNKISGLKNGKACSLRRKFCGALGLEKCVDILQMLY